MGPFGGKAFFPLEHASLRMLSPVGGLKSLHADLGSKSSCIKAGPIYRGRRFDDAHEKVRPSQRGIWNGKRTICP